MIYTVTSHAKNATMKEFWDERYSEREYIYGKEPNEFFRTWIDLTPPGKLLLPGEGEGRNAVYAASKHWDVIAYDQSEAAKEKALALALERGVGIEYRTGNMLDVSVDREMFDMVALVFFHLPEAMRVKFHKSLMACLRPGGLIVLESFGKSQVNRDSGGPKVPELLYMLDDVIGDFADLEVIYAASESAMLDEGEYHQGMADLVRFVGRKKIHGS